MKNEFMSQSLAEAFAEHRARLLSLVEKRLNPILLKRLFHEDVMQEVYLAAAKYDSTVPTDPLDEFWAALGDNVLKCRRTYRAEHSLMGARLTFAAELKDFILATPAQKRKP